MSVGDDKSTVRFTRVQSTSDQFTRWRPVVFLIHIVFILLYRDRIYHFYVLHCQIRFTGPQKLSPEN